jgi:hypothetical protein
MKDVDYPKLSGQYASFLVAVGGVSITVLTLVLSFNPYEKTAAPNISEALIETGKTAQMFLVAALIAATVSCFVGAHMMAETAAFFSETKSADETKRQLGQRLFVLATTNIFIAIALVLFSIVLLPTATGKPALAATLRLISLVGFLGIVLGALIWMALAAIDRMDVGNWGWIPAVLIGIGIGYFYYKSKELWPQLTFIFIVGVTAASLIYFAIIFKFEKARKLIARHVEVLVFSSAITSTYAFLVVAYLRILWGW